MLTVLSTACEARGTDATGIAYNASGRQHIFKRPIPAHLMWYRVPVDATIVMGHTRMTTQGSALRHVNNHPFRGRAGNTGFALAQMERETILQRQAEGIAIAKAQGVYKGRKPLERPEFYSVVSDWRNGKITAVEAMGRLRLSKTTFYRKVREQNL